MSGRRPAAVVGYCIVAGVLVVVGAYIGTSNLLRSSAIAPTITDIILAYLPLVFVAVGVAGMWFMRWWAVALFWLLVAMVAVGLLFLPFPGPSEDSLVAFAVSASIWIAVVAMPPTLIAIVHRRQFR